MAIGGTVRNPCVLANKAGKIKKKIKVTDKKLPDGIQAMSRER